MEDALGILQLGFELLQDVIGVSLAVRYFECLYMGLEVIGKVLEEHFSVSAPCLHFLAELKLCSEFPFIKNFVFSLVLQLSVLLLLNRGCSGLECCAISSIVYTLLQCGWK